MKNACLGRLARLAGTLALSIAAPCMAADGPGEAPVPPEDPARRAEIETLCKQLSDSDFQIRETATEKLLVAADDAVWALQQVAEGRDLEASVRAKEILEQVAWIPPAQRRQIEERCSALRDAKDANERSRCYQEILRYGKAGQRALEKLFTHPAVKPEDFEIRVEPDRAQIARGENVVFRVSLKNKGKEGVWIRPSALTVDASAMREVGAYPVANAKMQLQMVQIIRDMGAGMGGPFDLAYLKPGQSHEATVTAGEVQTDMIGWLDPVVSYKEDAGEAARIGGMGGMGGVGVVILRGGNAQLAGQLQAFQPSAAPLKLEAKGARVTVLPSSRPAAAGPVTIEAKAAGASCEAGKTLRVGLKVSSPEKDGIVIAAPREGAPAEGFWALYLDAKGEVVLFAPFAGAKDPPEAAETVRIKLDEPLSLEGEIPVPKAAGDYRLVIGYSAVEGPPGGRFIQGGVGRVGWAGGRRGRMQVQPAPAEKPADRPGSLWIGHLVSKEILVTVR